MIATVLTLALLALGALALLLGPLRARLPEQPSENASELDEEYRAALGDLRDLQEATARGEVDPALAERETLRLKGRAARLLAALEAQPVTPVAGQDRNVWRPALLGLLGAFAVIVVASFTVLPAWQSAGLSAAESTALRQALRLPDLARTAQRTGRVDDQLAYARAAFDTARYTEAARAYADVLRSERQNPEALRRLGIVLLQAGQKQQEAVTFISMAASLDPRSAEGQLFLGVALARAGEQDAAIAALERYRQLDPRGRDADELLTELRAQGRQDDVGLRVYRQSCASCHGAEGRGGVGPNLRADGLTREAMAAVIRSGAAGMPAYPDLKDDEMDALLDLIDSWRAEDR